MDHAKNCPKTFTILPKWQNFAKSCHTARAPALTS